MSKKQLKTNLFTRLWFPLQTEKQIREYNEMARKLKLIPPSAENANGIDFEMHFNPHSQRPDQRAHMDFKGTIKVYFSLFDVSYTVTTQNCISWNTKLLSTPIRRLTDNKW